MHIEYRDIHDTQRVGDVWDKLIVTTKSGLQYRFTENSDGYLQEYPYTVVPFDKPEISYEIGVGV